MRCSESPALGSYSATPSVDLLNRLYRQSISKRSEHHGLRGRMAAMDFRPITDFLNVHKESLTLFALAAIVTMRPKLPWPFSKVEAFEWAYEWGREALLTFISLRGPARSESSALEKTVTDEKGKVTESSVKVETSVSAPDLKSAQKP